MVLDTIFYALPEGKDVATAPSSPIIDNYNTFKIKNVNKHA